MTDRNDAEMNVFMDDGALHVKLILPAIVDSYSDTGEPRYAPPDINRAVNFARAAADALTAAGFKLSKGQQRSYGGGGGGSRPADPLPAMFEGKVPKCDGEGMTYHASYKNQAGKDVGARFTCVKEKQCTQGQNGYAKTVWADAWAEMLAQVGN